MCAIQRNGISISKKDLKKRFAADVKECLTRLKKILSTVKYDTEMSG
jgi:hypothetical protein